MNPKDSLRDGITNGARKLLPFVLAAALVPSAMAQQASLVVQCGSTGVCNATNTEWTLSKSGSYDQAATTATWTVNVAKGKESDAILTFKGSLTVTNAGALPATIGNIVVNLQRKAGKNWITASSDIANAAQGDAATSANICAPASSEGRSSFNENPASGTLEFTDAANNTVWSLTPQQVIAPGASVVLNYTASFNNTTLGIPDGEQVRTEVIVSFGNAGGRGGSGATCGQVDISGNGVLDADEAFVRSVPCRTTLVVPPLERSNAQAQLTDTEGSVSTTGDVAVTNYTTEIGAGSGVAILPEAPTRDAQSFGPFTITALVYPGANGGSITNCADLDGHPSPACNLALDRQACSTLDVNVAPPAEVKACSFTQGGWGATPQGNNPAALLANNFATVYPSGVEIGIPGTSGFSAKFTSATAVRNYLPAGGQAGALTADLTNPTSTSAGVFAGQVLALQLNVDFGNGGKLANGGVGSLALTGTGGSLDGNTVAQILAAANTALGGGGLPAGYTFATLNDLVTNLNGSFDNCARSDWATTHLVRP
jgi:hypothetical protein